MRKKSKLLLLFLVFLFMMGSVNFANANVVAINPQRDGTVIFFTYTNLNGEETLLDNYVTLDIDEFYINIYNVHENYSIVLEFYHAKSVNFTNDQLINVTKHYQKTFSNIPQYTFLKEKMYIDSSNETEVIRIVYRNQTVITFYHKTKPSMLEYGFLTRGEVTNLILISATETIAAAVFANYSAKWILERAKYVPDSLLQWLFFGSIPIVSFLGAMWKVVYEFFVMNTWIIMLIAYMIILPLALKLHNPQLQQILFEKLHILLSEENIEKEYKVIDISHDYLVIDTSSIKEFFIRLFGKIRKMEFLGRGEWYINDRSKTFERVYLYHEVADIKSSIVFDWNFEKARIVIFVILLVISGISGYIWIAPVFLAMFIKIKVEKGTFMVTLASTLYKEVEKVLVDLRRAASLVDAAESQKNRANLIEAELYVRALQLQEVREKIRIVYKRLAQKQITSEEAQTRLKKLLREEDKILQLMRPEELIEESKAQQEVVVQND